MTTRSDNSATPESSRSTICLNMIVRNEAHIVHELIDVVAPYISYWVIVDTGSTDGTQALIPELMEERGIPGELHERPWRDFGHNRTEALALAQGHCDYIWVMDADDTIVGNLKIGVLTADAYSMRIQDGLLYWRLQLFRDGMPWRYTGVLHELAVCDTAFRDERLQGDYHVHSRRLGGRNRDPRKYQKDVEVLLAEVDRHPDDARSVFYLAQSYVSAGELEKGRQWYARRAEMGGWEEEVYYSLFCIATLMERLGEPWPLVQEAYLRAWSQRPSRAEPLYAVARRHRIDRNYVIGHLFAERAAEIPLPEGDVLFVSADVYNWRALDEQAVCASWIGRTPECFAICRQILALPELPEQDRQRIAANRDLGVPMLREAAGAYPEQLPAPTAPGEPVELTLTLIAGADRQACERTLNSFLRCCLDHERIQHYLVFDAGLSAEDRFSLLDRYRFLEFQPCPPEALQSESQWMAMRHQLNGRLWLHIGQGWQFFAPDHLISRLQAVLAVEPQVIQVGLNHQDASSLTGTSPSESEVRRAEDVGRYVLSDGVLTGPALLDLQRFDAAIDQQGAWLAPPMTATLDEVLCERLI